MRDVAGRWVRVLCAIVLVLPVASCGRAPGALQLSGPTMGTTYHVVVTALPPAVSRGDVEAAIATVLEEADRYLSGWNPDSELARFNRSRSTDWEPVSPLLHAAVAEALSISESSGGAFDPTVGPLVRAWGFGAGAVADSPAPSAATIAQLLARVGHSRLELRSQPAALRKTLPELTIDLDGIAPGLAVDRLAMALDALGIRDYLVEIGGEVRSRGASPGRRPWRVAVEAPLARERRAQAVIVLSDAAVSTSGDYRDYREIDGRRYSHTIDPRVGRPVAHAVASVTVVHASAAAADAWATALMVLGPQQGLALAGREGLAALFILRAGPSGRFEEMETAPFTRLRVPQGARL